jgi:hypothetical protein
MGIFLYFLKYATVQCKLFLKLNTRRYFAFAGSAAFGG